METFLRERRLKRAGWPGTVMLAVVVRQCGLRFGSEVFLLARLELRFSVAYSRS